MYKVMLRKNATGEQKLVEIADDWYQDGLSEYMWEDGNYACDCNRAAFFGDDPCECGEIAYTALYAVLEDGRQVKLDDDEDAQAA